MAIGLQTVVETFAPIYRTLLSAEETIDTWLSDPEWLADHAIVQPSSNNEVTVRFSIEFDGHITNTDMDKLKAKYEQVGWNAGSFGLVYIERLVSPPRWKITFVINCDAFI